MLYAFWDNWFVPLLVTAGFHAFIVYFVLTGYELAPIEIIPTKVEKVIQAKLVQAPRVKQKVLPSKAVVAPPKPKVEQLARPQDLPEVGDYKQPDSLSIEQSTDVTPVIENEVDVSSLMDAIAAEENLLQEESDLGLVDKYTTLMRARIESKWSRPPSARNGMQASLVIRLVPSGEVVSVTLESSSGSEVFDRSAINAVWQVERFSELAGIEARLFEAYFRELNLVFKPEDLLL